MALPAPGGDSLMVANPLGVRSLGPVLSTVLIGTLNGLAVLVTVLLAAAFVSLVVRYRSGGREVRQQIKWITLAAAAIAVCQVAALLAIATTGTASNPVTTAAYAVMPVIALFGIPALITVAILKHGLYQIDVIINRAIRYGLLSAALTAIYVVIVVGIGTTGRLRGRPVAHRRGGLAIAVLFQPLRRRAQLSRTGSCTGSGPRPTRCCRLRAGHGGPAGRRRGTGPDGVGPGRRHRRGPGGGLGPGRAAAAPAGDLAARIRPARGRSRSLARPCCRPSTRRRGRSRSATGTSCSARSPCRKPRNEPVSAAEDKLLEHLASQAGLVLRNVRLTAELQATHRRPAGVAAAAGAGPG